MSRRVNVHFEVQWQIANGDCPVLAYIVNVGLSMIKIEII